MKEHRAWKIQYSMLFKSWLCGVERECKPTWVTWTLIIWRILNWSCKHTKTSMTFTKWINGPFVSFTPYFLHRILNYLSKNITVERPRSWKYKQTSSLLAVMQLKEILTCRPGDWRPQITYICVNVFIRLPPFIYLFFHQSFLSPKKSHSFFWKGFVWFIFDPFLREKKTTLCLISSMHLPVNVWLSST